MISSHVKILMISLISNLYLNSLVYHRNIFGPSSKVFGNLRKSSDIFGNSLKMFKNVRLAFGTILENLRKSWENHQKCRHQCVYIIKRTLHVSSKMWILCSRGKNSISLLRCTHSWDIVLMPLEHKIHIFSPLCNILYNFIFTTPGSEYNIFEVWLLSLPALPSRRVNMADSCKWIFHLFGRHHCKSADIWKDGEFSKWLLSSLDQKTFQELVFKTVKNRKRSG